ncbi:membrane protein [Gordonia phage Lilbeanie]|uniref:Membrane protein n=1 Tax=Gordonia phage Lilbeanie TaxID=2794947 RepID=A0A7T1KSD8_9CAUD|nr:membrane protein [Gordonia phage Lilbeanie]QPO17176.1 membrane protein [Gordonia phage Lilbeanie]
MSLPEPPEPTGRDVLLGAVLGLLFVVVIWVGVLIAY